MSAEAWGLLFLLSFLWGGSFLFNGVAVAELPPVTLVFLRVALAAAVLVAVLGARGERVRPTMAEARDAAVMGLLNNVVPFVLIVWGQKHIASGLAAIVNATTPIFAVLLTHLLTSEKAGLLKFAGVGLGLLGVAILVGPDRFDTASAALLGELACLAAAFFYGLSSVWGRRFRGRPSLPTAAWQLSASALILLPLSLAVDAPWSLPLPSPRVLAAVAALAIVSTALAYILFFRIITLAGPTSAVLVTLLVPVFAILFGTVFLGERLAPQHFAGMAVIALGLLAIDGRLPRALGRRLGRA
ncbi:DMT family transporter [Prosthecomicrobium sp. N25]|uniref:DMT family transporter n=1 Tax=Prosthecomicrobium sp. N25 TaxID=3129254 RepID=UPI0030772119